MRTVHVPLHGMAASLSMTDRSASAHQLGQLLFYRRPPDVVALRERMQEVGTERVGQEVARVVEELAADVEIEDVLLIVELPDDLVHLGDLVANRIVGRAAREDGQQ